MSVEVNIHEAKTHLSRLIARASAGEDIVIAKAGVPLVRLVRYEKRKPVLGTAKGTIKFRKGWDKPLTDKEIDELIGE